MSKAKLQPYGLWAYLIFVIVAISGFGAYKVHDSLMDFEKTIIKDNGYIEIYRVNSPFSYTGYKKLTSGVERVFTFNTFDLTGMASATKRIEKHPDKGFVTITRGSRTLRGQSNGWCLYKTGYIADNKKGRVTEKEIQKDIKWAEKYLKNVRERYRPIIEERK